jgi:hypothetical protein
MIHKWLRCLPVLVLVALFAASPALAGEARRSEEVRPVAAGFWSAMLEKALHSIQAIWAASDRGPTMDPWGAQGDSGPGMDPIGG